MKIVIAYDVSEWTRSYEQTDKDVSKSGRYKHYRNIDITLTFNDSMTTIDTNIEHKFHSIYQYCEIYYQDTPPPELYVEVQELTFQNGIYREIIIPIKVYTTEPKIYDGNYLLKYVYRPHQKKYVQVWHHE